MKLDNVAKILQEKNNIENHICLAVFSVPAAVMLYVMLYAMMYIIPYCVLCLSPCPVMNCQRVSSFHYSIIKCIEPYNIIPVTHLVIKSSLIMCHLVSYVS